MDIPLQSIGKDIQLGKVVIENVILISNKKIPKDAIKYLQVAKKSQSSDKVRGDESYISDSPPQSSKSSHHRDLIWPDPSPGYG